MLTEEEYKRQVERIARWKTMEPEDVLEDMTEEERALDVQVELSGAMVEFSGFLHLITKDDRYLDVCRRGMKFAWTIRGDVTDDVMSKLKDEQLENFQKEVDGLESTFNFQCPEELASLARELGKLLVSYPGDQQPEDVDREEGP